MSTSVSSTAQIGGEPAELLRCRERDEGHQPWDRWGTYLSDRQWGTVREDYSGDGNAWNSFDHSHLRSYRWGRTACWA